MANFGNIESFDPKNPEKSITYLERMNFFFLANDIVKVERRKAIFLTLIGAETYAIARSLASPSFVEYDDLIKLLTDHFGDESVSAYDAELRKLSDVCEFMDLEDRLRDRLVCGLRKESIVKRSLSESNLTFEKALNIAICDESASAGASVLQERITEVTMMKKASKTEPPKFKSSKVHFKEFKKMNNKIIICIRCKGNHMPNVCKFRNANCFKCGKIGHVQKACLTNVVADGLDPNILGRQWFSAFRLKLNFLNSLETNPISPDFEELFKKEIDVYNGPLIHIDIPDNAEPKFVKPRTVPFALRNLVDENLKVLEGPVKFTKWASPIKFMDTLLIGIDEVAAYLDDDVLTAGRLKIDYRGVHPSDEKLRAIKDVRPPCNKKELKSFFGILNYYERFLNNKATVAEPLHRLLNSNNPWKWNKEHQRSFAEVKNMISSRSVLAHFNEDLPILVNCDASEYGVGAILSQIDHGFERAVVFASRTLNKTERRYAVIDKEALAVIFGVSKFSQYLLGRKFKILTDHKPLVGIFNPKKPIPQVLSPRMLRWCLTLAAYTYTIEYKPGKFRTLQRCFFIEAEHAAINSSEVAKLTSKDPILSKIKFWAMNGWPERRVDDKFKDFVSKSNEISVHKDCLLWGSKVIIPERLRKYILNLLHDTHIGIVGTKALARGLCWWPGMDRDIERMISSLDAYSKWIEAKIVSTTSTETTINSLKEIFATHGLPDVIVSDNGTSVTSELFKTFLKRNGVRHILCAPYHAASNGQVERAIQTLKNLLRKNSSGNWTTRLSRSLLSMRIAINSTTQKSPAQLLMNRNLRSLINKFHPESVSEGSMRQEDRFMRNCKPHRVVNEGQAVIARGYHGPRWLPGVVQEKTGPVSIKVETDDGEILNRHLNQVRVCGESEATPSTSSTLQESTKIEDPQAGQEIDPTAETLTFLEYVALDEGLEICGSPELEEKKKEETEDDEVKEEIMMPTRGEVIAALETLQKLSKTSADIDVHFEDDLDKIRRECLKQCPIKYHQKTITDFLKPEEKTQI
ncbi:K02A2.6-like [Cordylochernes scorpioides]|uniref:K02A2.6-like n=1 Tax=Cordylochernes scorpioides TaxID=51811 RepID=A0ABY6LMK7_9ARAC|nr:K02A2.6-like [Cordylochernes scorpioides]